jgi:IS4 transposase
VRLLLRSRNRQATEVIHQQFTLPPLAIAEIYKKRWAVELFFRWIKQHLRIKAFYGTSENAVKTHFNWTAVMKNIPFGVG